MTLFQTLPDPAEFKPPPGRRNENCSEPKVPPKAHADPQWQSLGVWALMGLWSYSCMISATTPQGALSWGDRGQPQDSYEVWENPVTLRPPNAMDVLLTHSQMISLTMWQTSLCLKKLQGVVGNGTVAWQCVREILLLSLVSCCVCVCVCVF